METTKTVVPLTLEIKDGNGMIHLHANPNHSENVQQSGIVELAIIGRQKRHDPDITVSKITDPNTGIIYGKVIGIDEKTKGLTYQPIRLAIRQVYDCANPLERESWMVIQRHHLAEGCPYPTNQKPLFRKVDREQDAKMKILKINFRTRALELIEGMENGELVDMAVNMGITSNYSSGVTLKAELMTTAESKPKEFCELYDNANRKVITVLNRARTVGLVTTDPNQGLLWKLTLTLGMTEAAAVNHLNKNMGLLQTMDFESKQKSPMFQKMATEEEKKSAISVSEEAPKEVGVEIMSNKDINVVLDRLAVKEKQLDDLIKNNQPKQEPPTPEPVKEEPPLEKFQAKAASLGMRDAYKEKDRDVLKKFILEKQKKKESV